MKSRFVVAALTTFVAAGLWSGIPTDIAAQPFRGGDVKASAAAAREAGEAIHRVGNRRHGHRHRYWRRHGWHRDRDFGPALGGFAAGVIIGGALAAQQDGSDRHAYCASRYRSYDPRTGTYLDGERHRCP